MRGRHGLLAGLFLAGLALRPQIVGVGPLLPRIQASLHVSHAVAGLLSTIPLLCMGLFAPLAPRLLRTFGSQRAVSLSLALVVAMGVVRALVPGAALVLAFTIPLGVGIAVAGTLGDPRLKDPCFSRMSPTASRRDRNAEGR